MRRVVSLAGLSDASQYPPQNPHVWLVDRLQRLHDHLQQAPRRPRSQEVVEEEDGLDGLEDCQVDSDEELDDPDRNLLLSRRPSNKRARHIIPHPIAAATYVALPNLPDLPLDDDVPLFSARSSQACIDQRPHFRLPIGSAANSYLTKMSSWKSLGYGETNKLHKDYSKIFRREEEEPLPPGESSIQIAGGDLYNLAPLAERWVLAEKIGEGGYATVRVARRKHPMALHPPPENRLAAVKIISKTSLDLYNEKMVSREVFSFRLLDMAGGHDNIVELYEVCEDDDNVYLVMELLEGGELFTRISERGQYTERDAANLVVSMLASLAFCHRLNLTHRDVKPENFVCMEADGDDADIKLTDFGIAHYSEDPSALCKTLCGTPLYVAPEVLLRQPYGPEADLWSLGVIVYIMLVGYPPFDDNDLVQLVKKIKYRPVKFDAPEWSLISSEGKQFLTNLLDKDASSRMTAQQALEHDWLRNNCQAATKNVLDVAQSNIKSFVNRKRWKAAIQGVKAMNRIHRIVELSRDGQIDDLDDISAEKVEVVLVQRPEQRNGSRVDSIMPRQYSSSSSEEGSIESRPTPVANMTSKCPRPPPMPLRYSANGRKRISSLVVPNVGKKPPLPPAGESGASMVLLPIDPAFESSDDSGRTRRERSGRRVETEGTEPYMSALIRVETSPIVGHDGMQEHNSRVGRSMTKTDGGVVRKMSSHARKLVGKGFRGKTVSRANLRNPVMLEMGEHRKQKRFPWFK